MKWKKEEEIGGWDRETCLAYHGWDREEDAVVVV